MIALCRELWARRELIGILVSRNLKIRYKQSALGFFWSLLGPLFLIVIYWAFLEILKVEISITSLVAGILVWQFLAMCLNDSLYAILGNANLVTKTAFPRMVLPLSIVLANLVNFLLSLAVLVVFLLVAPAGAETAARTPLTLLGHAALLPLIVLSHGALCLGLALMLCSLNVFFRDVEHILGVAMLAWFFLSPVVYPNTFILSRFNPTLHAVYFMNPMAGVVTAYRNVFLNTDFLPGWMLVIPFCLCWAVLLCGVTLFCRLEPRFGDEL
jgi:lipopolysaccharide transport system permease protein